VNEPILTVIRSPRWGRSGVRIPVQKPKNWHLLLSWLAFTI